MYTLSNSQIETVNGGVIKGPNSCANGMLAAGGFGAAFGGILGGLIGSLGGPVGVAFGAALGASLFGGGASAVAAQGSACSPVLMCTKESGPY
jgi:hypothetical protein